MGEKIKIVIIQTEILVGNFHWTCFRLPPDTTDVGFKMMGCQIVEMDKSEAEELLRKQSISMELQIQLGHLFTK